MSQVWAEKKCPTWTDSNPSSGFHTVISHFLFQISHEFCMFQKVPNFPCSKSGEICSKIFHVPNLATVLWYFFIFFPRISFLFFHSSINVPSIKCISSTSSPIIFPNTIFHTKITAHFPICFQCSWDVFPKTIVSVSHSNDNTDNAETN